MSDAESSLGELLSELEQPDFDTAHVDRARRALAESLSLLSRATPRAELERILVLHAALRALVERRHAEAARSLDAVVRARARNARLTRPDDKRSALDVDA